MMNVHICTLTQARLLTQHASVPVGIISLFLKITAARMLACSDRVPTPATLSVFLFNFFFSLFHFRKRRFNAKQRGRFAANNYACPYRSFSSIPASLRAQMRPSWSQERSRNASLWQRASLKRSCTIHADLLLFSVSPLVASMQPLHSPSDQHKVQGPLTGESSHPDQSINFLKHLLMNARMPRW